MSNFEREILWVPGWDHRQDPDPKKSRYGQHGPEIIFKVKNGKGAITLDVSTSWGANDIAKGKGPLNPLCQITWHIIEHRDPTKNTWEPTKECGYLGGRTCQGGRASDYEYKWLKRLCLEPLENTWKWLEETLLEKIKEADV